MQHKHGLKNRAILLGVAALFAASSLGAAGAEDWGTRPHYSSIGFALGYNTYSHSGGSWYTDPRNDFKGTNGMAGGFRVLLSPNILGHFLSFGGEWQSLTIARYDSSTWYYVESGKPTEDASFVDLWQVLVGMTFIHSEAMILQTQIGYGKWSSGKEFGEFTELAATVRLVAALPLIDGVSIMTFDPEIAYTRGLGDYKNSAFSIELGFSFRF